MSEEDILKAIAEPEDEPDLDNEIVYIEGKKLDLSVNTRGDLIHMLRSQISRGDRIKKEYLDAIQMFAAAALTNGGKLRVTREAFMSLGPKSEVIKEQDQNNLDLIIHVIP